jgi:hypothetical protein
MLSTCICEELWVVQYPDEISDRRFIIDIAKVVDFIDEFPGKSSQ